MTTLPSSTSPPASIICAAKSLGTVNFPVTIARSWPCLTKSESDLLPSTNPKAVSTIVLPAPVSPVNTVKPGLNSMLEDSITPRDLIEISSNLLLPTFLLPTPTLDWQLKFCHQAICEGGSFYMCQ